MPNHAREMVSKRNERAGIGAVRRFLPTLGFAVLVHACETPPDPAAEPASGNDPVSPLAAAAASVEAADFAARIGFLADDLMRGRATPSDELDLAARYIASEFAVFGLEPGGDDGSFLQWYALDDGARAPNVAGILRGSDPVLRETYLVYSAHMDHLGVGLPDASGDSVYNGADDDASGTAAVIEIAEAFASLPTRPARSVVFLTVSGEETWLNGSLAFITGSRIPVRAMIANINMDMIGRNAPDTVVAIGMRYSDLGSRLVELAGERTDLGLTVQDDPWPQERFFFRSDHYTFARAGVPAIFFFAGVHEDYHSPSDEADTIDTDKAARIARLAFWLGLEIANAERPPEWTRAGLTEVRPDNR